MDKYARQVSFLKLSVDATVLEMFFRVEDALETAGIRYDRLDGTMKRDERSRAMDALKQDPGCEVLLVSLKAGGVGLNLTAAQRVYLMDPYWCAIWSLIISMLLPHPIGILLWRTKR